MGFHSGWVRHWWDTIINNLFQVQKHKKAAQNPKEAGAVLSFHHLSSQCGHSSFDVHPLIHSLRSSLFRLSGGLFCVFVLPSRLCWCQSLVLEVIFEGLRQREAFNLLKPLPAQCQTGGTPAQVHQRKRLSWGEQKRDNGLDLHFWKQPVHCWKVYHLISDVWVCLFVWGPAPLPLHA